MSGTPSVYGSDFWSLPKFMRTALSQKSDAIRVLSEDEHQIAEAASLGRFPAVASDIDWASVDGAEFRRPNTDLEEARDLAEVLQIWVSGTADVIISWQSSTIPTVQISISFLLASVADLIESPLWPWIYSPSDHVLIEVNRVLGISSARIPGD